MTDKNQELVDRFFAAYGARDMEAVRLVMSDDVRWTALGQHPLAGVKNGLEEVIAFFDGMGAVMGKSNPRVEKLVVGENDNYLVECQRVWTNRADGHDLDHRVCVLWRFENGKIVEGTHFFADPQATDTFFNYALGKHVTAS